MKPAIRSRQAGQDIQQALDYYVGIRVQTARQFLDALEQAIAHIQSHPGSGSPRYAHELGIPQLRFWMLDGFPYAVFYIEHHDHLDVIRLPHLHQDIPETFR